MVAMKPKVLNPPPEEDKMKYFLSQAVSLTCAGVHTVRVRVGREEDNCWILRIFHQFGLFDLRLRPVEVLRLSLAIPEL